MGRTSGAVEEGAFGAWRVAGGRYVECSLAVLEQLRASAVDGLRALPRGGLEIGGVLFGVEKAGVVRITAQVPLPCEHALGPGFVLSANDRKALNNILAGTDPCLAGVRPVGWYRSQTGAMSRSPSATASCTTPASPSPGRWYWYCGLSRASRARAAFFARTSEGGLAGGEEFEIAPAIAPQAGAAAGPSGCAAPAGFRRTLPCRNRLRHAPSPSERLAPDDCRTIVFLLVALGVAGFSYGSLTAPAGPLDFGLRVVDEKGK